MTDAQTDPSGTCRFCGWRYRGRPTECRLCGTLLNDAAEDVKRQAEAGRKPLKAHKALADTFFLMGLLLGGPMMSFGGNLRIGLFVVLAGGFASTLRRYTVWPTAASVVLGCLGGIIAAVTLVAPAPDSPEDAGVARAAYASVLAQKNIDVFVDLRGLENVAIWFTVPQDLLGECGAYPAPEVRAHLKDLGFRRVVVKMQNQSGGLCSFSL